MTGETLYAVLLTVSIADKDLAPSKDIEQRSCAMDRTSSRHSLAQALCPLTRCCCLRDRGRCHLEQVSMRSSQCVAKVRTVLVGVLVTLGTVSVNVAIMVLVVHAVVVALTIGVVVSVIQAVGVSCIGSAADHHSNKDSYIQSA